MSIFDFGDDLGSAFQRLREDAARFMDHVAPIIKDPAGSAQKLRAVNGRSPIGNENTDLYEWADRFGCLLDFTRFTGWDQRDIRQKLVRADLQNVCLEIMMRADFWQSPWYFCMGIVKSTVVLVHEARENKDRKLVRTLNTRTNDLWRSVWEKRTQWKSLRTRLPDPEPYPNEQPLVTLLAEWSEFFIDQGRMPFLDTYMPLVGLHVWLQYGGDGLVLTRIRTAFVGLVTIDAEKTRQLFRDEGIAGACAGKVVSGIKRELVQSQSAHDFVHVTPLLFALTNCDDLLPFYESHSLMHEVRCTLDRFSDTPASREEKITAYNSLTTYLTKYTRTAHAILSGESSDQLGLNGSDLLHVLALSIQLLASDGGARVENGMDADFCENLDDLVCGWTIRDMEGSSALLKSFQNEVEVRARAEWWPSLHRLQITIRRAGPDVLLHRMKKLAKNWAAFGTALGLDIDEERARHEKGSRNRCSWAECKYHREKPDDVALSTCKGCGEVRYCGRECQKNDWSKGGHKVRCGDRVK